MRQRFLSLFCVLVLAFGNIAHADDRDEMLRKMDAQAEHYGKLSRQIWEFAEVGYKEKQSAELLKT